MRSGLIKLFPLCFQSIASTLPDRQSKGKLPKNGGGEPYPRLSFRRAGTLSTALSPLVLCRRDEPGGCRLDPGFELGQHRAPFAAWRDRRQDFDRDPAGALQEPAAAPEEAGIDRDRRQRHVEAVIERGDARLVGAALTDRAAGSFR